MNDFYYNFVSYFQWFTFSDWPGGIYATSTISGSKAGGITAACWASLVHHGRSGYVDSTRKIVKTTKYIAQVWPLTQS